MQIRTKLDALVPMNPVTVREDAVSASLITGG
jgi:hypothetical protein